MQLDFDLQLTERLPDRVLVSVVLRPTGNEPVALQGVAVMLVCPAGEPLSHRMVLPIAGLLNQPIVTTVELRGREALPVGTKIIGLAWTDTENWEARIPADPGTQLQAHCLGQVYWRPEPDPDFDLKLEPLSMERRLHLAAVFPFLMPCKLAEPTVMDDETESEELRTFCEGLGLDEEDTDWIQDLLKE